jgi:hypothetical protein
MRGSNLSDIKTANEKVNGLIGVRRMTNQDFLNPGGNKFWKAVKIWDSPIRPILPQP